VSSPTPSPQLERSGHRHDRDRLGPDAGFVELLKCRLQELVRDLPVELRGDDRDAAARAVGRPLDDVDVIRDVELAVGMLLGLRRRLGLLFDLELLVLFDFRPALAHSLSSYFRSWW
jgi:hypothetical protein